MAAKHCRNLIREGAGQAGVAVGVTAPVWRPDEPQRSLRHAGVLNQRPPGTRTPARHHTPSALL